MSYDKWWEDTDEDFKRKLIDQELEDADLQDNPIATEGWGVFLAKGLSKVGISSLENKLSQKSADKIMSVFKEPRVVQWIYIQAELILKQASLYAKKFINPDIKITFATSDDVKKYSDNPLNGIIDYDGTSKITTDLEFKKCFTFNIKCGKYMLQVNADSTSIKRVFLFLKTSEKTLNLATIKAPDDQELLKIVGAIESAEIVEEGVISKVKSLLGFKKKEADDVKEGYYGELLARLGEKDIVTESLSSDIKFELGLLGGTFILGAAALFGLSYFNVGGSNEPYHPINNNTPEDTANFSKQFMAMQKIDTAERKAVYKEAFNLVKKQFPPEYAKDKHVLTNDIDPNSWGAPDDFFKGQINIVGIAHTASKVQWFPNLLGGEDVYKMKANDPNLEKAKKKWEAFLSKCESAVNKELAKKYKGKYRIFFEDIYTSKYWDYYGGGDGDEGAVILVDIDMVNRMKRYIANHAAKESYEPATEGVGVKAAENVEAAGWASAFFGCLATIFSFGYALNFKGIWAMIIGGYVVDKIGGGVKGLLQKKGNKYLEKVLANPEMSAYIRNAAKEVVAGIKKQAASMKDSKYEISTKAEDIDKFEASVFNQGFKAPGEETDSRIEFDRKSYFYIEKKLGEYSIVLLYDTNSIKGIYVVVAIKDTKDKFGSSWLRARPIPPPTSEELKKMGFKG